MRSFEEDMEAAAAYHGHVCSGIILGVRMARLGAHLLGIEDPRTYRDLVVYIEVDRCATDAIYAVTGCTLGCRRLKWLDYGKMAATFCDLATDKAVRLVVMSERFPPEGSDLMRFWEAIPDDDIFKIQQVEKLVPPEDRPGRPLRQVKCQDCGEWVLDGKEAAIEGRLLCRGCAFIRPASKSSGPEGHDAAAGA